MERFNCLELFAGCGGLALGLELAGFCHTLLNEIDKDCCDTLRKNRPNWNVLEADVRTVSFKSCAGVDLVSGGFPCQAFSHAGERRGFADARGSLFWEYARAIAETQPKLFLAENVPGLLTHDQGNTLQIIRKTLEDLGYKVLEPKVLNAAKYRVPQKRERLFLVGIRQDLSEADFSWPEPFPQIYTLRDALKAGVLYPTDVPPSPGVRYSKAKEQVLDLVPPGGCWRHLPLEIQKSYMKATYYQTGGKTGVARRLTWDEPSLTLTCSPSQKQTERCHPQETRPLTVREYARIQTFPDEWKFCGGLTSQYRQIGNAVPVNLAEAIGVQLIQLLKDCNAYEK